MYYERCGLIDTKYTNYNATCTNQFYDQQVFDVVLRDRGRVDQAIANISRLLKNKEFILAMNDFEGLLKTRVLYFDQLEQIQILGNQIKTIASKLVRSWNVRVFDPKEKQSVYQEMLGYCRLIARDELAPSYSFKAFSFTDTKSRSVAEIERTCGAHSIAVLTTILQGSCLLHMGRHYEAYSRLIELRKKFPNLYLLNLTIGKVFLASGNGEKAVCEFNALLDEYYAEIEVYIGLALAHEVAGHTLLAYDWCHQARKLDRANVTVNQLYKRYQQQIGFLY